jgi:hypothetical protein
VSWCRSDIKVEPDRLLAAQLSVRVLGGEQVGLHMEAAAGAFVDAHLGAVILQQHQAAQRFGVGDVEVIAGDNAHPGGWPALLARL